MEYKECNGALEPIRVHTLVISVNHAPDIPLQQIQNELMEKVVKKVIPEKYLDEGTIYHLLPSEKFVEGGPKVRYFEKQQPMQTWIPLHHMLVNVLLNNSAMEWCTFNQKVFAFLRKLQLFLLELSCCTALI